MYIQSAINPSYDWPDYRFLYRIIISPCGCKTGYYFNGKDHWTYEYKYDCFQHHPNMRVI